VVATFNLYRPGQTDRPADADALIYGGAL
jgi:hypothetical protein